MPNFNSGLVPTITPGTIFDRFLSDETINIRWLTALDPAYFEAINRPMADITLRQLIIAKALDTQNAKLGAASIFPFLITPQVTNGSSSVELPVRLFWDMHVSIPGRWRNLRLARVDRISGANNPDITGTARFIWAAEDSSDGDTEKALFYADYEIDSDVTYQIAPITLVDSGIANPLTAAPDGQANFIGGLVVFRTGDLDDSTFSSFFEFVGPGTNFKYEVVDTDGSEVETFSEFGLSHGRGLMVASAFNVIPGTGGAGTDGGTEGGSGLGFDIEPAGSSVTVTFDDSTNTFTIGIDPTEIAHQSLNGVGSFTHADIDDHIVDKTNPHAVTAAQVGRDTAQWNASKIQGTPVDGAAPAATNDILAYNLGTNRYEPKALSSDILTVDLPSGDTVSLTDYVSLIPSVIIITEVSDTALSVVKDDWQPRRLNTIAANSAGSTVSLQNVTFGSDTYSAAVRIPKGNYIIRAIASTTHGGDDGTVTLRISASDGQIINGTQTRQDGDSGAGTVNSMVAYMEFAGTVDVQLQQYSTASVNRIGTNNPNTAVGDVVHTTLEFTRIG